jgi:hypothetical protein
MYMGSLAVFSDLCLNLALHISTFFINVLPCKHALHYIVRPGSGDEAWQGALPRLLQQHH